MAENVEIKEYEGKLVHLGNSLHISVPAYIRHYLDLQKGDKMRVKLTLVEKSKKRPRPDSNW